MSYQPSGTHNVEITYSCGHTVPIHSPGVADPAAVYADLPKCPDGMIRVSEFVDSRWTCNAHPQRIHPFDLGRLINAPGTKDVTTLLGTSNQPLFRVNGTVYEPTTIVAPTPEGVAEYGPK
jgi:hypothetical protein